LHARYRSRRRVVVDLDAPLGSDAPTVISALGALNDGVTLESVSPDGLRLEFGLLDGANAGALVARVAGTASLRDLSVIEPDIEDVVARLYRG
jgi:ABC-2 type transport system ATP-binding protein